MHDYLATLRRPVDTNIHSFITGLSILSRIELEVVLRLPLLQNVKMSSSHPGDALISVLNSSEGWLRDASSSPAAVREKVSEYQNTLERWRMAILDKERRLNAVWNSTLPVNRLPNELIVYIFILYTESHGSIEPNFRWTRILAVCRHWYTVACATPQLWRHIRVPGRPEWVELCLVRSAQCTVDVYLARQCVSAGSLDLILPHAHRIRSLYWPDTVDAWLQGQTVFRLINCAMPSLETLTIFRRLGNEGTIETLFSSDLLSGRYPRLRSVALKGAAIPGRGSFPNLRSLSLVSCLLQDMTFDSFVGFLSRMRLQELFLYDILSRLSGGSSDRGPRRSLPKLTKLVLGNHPPHASSQFLSRVALPSLASMKVSARNDYVLYPAGNAQSLSALLPSDRATSLPMFSSTAFISLTVLSGHLTIVSSRRCPRDPQECIDLDIPIEPLNVCLPHAFQELLLLYAGAPVKHLSVEAYHGFDVTDPWVPVLHAFPDLEHLSLHGMGDLLDVSLALTPERDAGDHEGKSGVVCPSLRSLLFEGKFDVLPDSVQALLDCLRYRAERGSRLEEFTWISHAGSNERYRQPLEELVGEVDLKAPHTRSL
ncbi:hypothetical protein C8Q74DRAFT_312174 [Fomes fomentarius]|nr:hypothetical protein C8Q74DRAFT_312174 [Fomes fomentarius]